MRARACLMLSRASTLLRRFRPYNKFYSKIALYIALQATHIVPRRM